MRTSRRLHAGLVLRVTGNQRLLFRGPCAAEAARAIVFERDVRLTFGGRGAELQPGHPGLGGCLLGPANRGGTVDEHHHHWDLPGTYPNSRYFSLSVYTPYGTPFSVNGVSSSLKDYRIAPEQGSTNPWQHRAAPGWSYRVTVRSAVAPGEPNVLPHPLAPPRRTSATSSTSPQAGASPT